MSENRFVTSCRSASNIQGQTTSENQDIGIVLHEIPLNEIQSQSDCIENVTTVAHPSIQANSISPAIEESQLIQNNMSEQSAAVKMKDKEQQQSSMHLSEGMIEVNVSRDTPVTTAVIDNLPSSINTLVEKKNSDILTDSAGINNSKRSEMSNEEKRWRFYHQGIKIEDPTIIVSDDDSVASDDTFDKQIGFVSLRLQKHPLSSLSESITGTNSFLATNVPESSPIYSISDTSVDNEVTDQNQTYSFDIPKNSFKSFADIISEFNMNQKNIAADIVNVTTDNSMENKVNDKQQTNSSDITLDLLNPTADVPAENDQDQTNVAMDISKDPLNSIADTPVENAVTDQLQSNSTDDRKDSLSSIDVIPVKNAVITEQTNSTSSNDDTERYNRDECHMKVIPVGERNRKESLAVAIAVESNYVAIDSIDDKLKSEESESPTKRRTNVSERKKPVQDECGKPLDDDVDQCDKPLGDDSEDSPNEFTLIDSEDGSILLFGKIPSEELSNVKDDNKFGASDEVILLSDIEEPSRWTDKPRFVTTSRTDNQILIERIKSSSKSDLMKLCPFLDVIKTIHEAFEREELLDVGERFIDTSIQTVESDIDAASDHDETLNRSLVDLASDVEEQVRVQEALLELEVQKLDQKTDGQSSKLTEKLGEESHDNISTAAQFPRCFKKAKKRKVTNDDVYMTSKSRKRFKSSDQNLAKFSLKIVPNDPCFESNADQKIVKGKKRFSAETSTSVGSPKKKPKYSLQRGFFGRSMSNIRAKWRDQRKKIKSKLSFKHCQWPKLQRTSAGNFSVTAFPEEVDCENVSGFSVIPT